MAHSLSAQKRVRQNLKARSLNRWRLTAMRDAVKDFREAILHGTVEKAAESLKTTLKVIDKTAAKGVIHKNQAARRKSRLTKTYLAKKNAK
ncbi:MAG: 30S ribosomal protein S20 [Planctomycetota bacterium]|jgi:small subunit ribosomal protein S20|nr:30S ribosomal protein S20 [Planctomycetota bacterium]